MMILNIKKFERCIYRTVKILILSKKYFLSRCKLSTTPFGRRLLNDDLHSTFQPTYNKPKKTFETKRKFEVEERSKREKSSK